MPPPRRRELVRPLKPIVAGGATLLAFAGFSCSPGPTGVQPAGARVVLISTRDQDDFADLIAASPAAGFLPKNLLSARAVRDLVAPGNGC